MVVDDVGTLYLLEEDRLVAVSTLKRRRVTLAVLASPSRALTMESG